MSDLAIASYTRAAFSIVADQQGKAILFPDLIVLIYINHQRVARYADIINHVATTQNATISWGRLQAGLKRLRERGCITMSKDGRAFLYVITMAGTETVKRYHARLRELADGSPLSQ